MSFVDLLRHRLVADREFHDLSRNADLASLPLIGYRLSPAALDFAAFVPADELTESQIVALRDEFFDAVRRVSTGFSLRTPGVMPNGLLGFVFEAGCTERMARFVRRQTRISHHASTGAVAVSWAIDVTHRRVHTHANPVSVLPPVIVVPQTVYPGLAWLEAALRDLPADLAPMPDEPTAPPVLAPAPASPGPPTPAEPARILFLGANSVEHPLDVEREVSSIEQALRMSRERDALEFRQVGAVTIDLLMQAMIDVEPAFVHFAGHGDGGGIFLRDEVGNPRRVSGDALAGLFALFRDSVRCVVLNACWSEAQARAIREHVPHVVGTRFAIPDAAARAFSAGFYRGLGAGWNVPRAFEAGKTRVHLEGCGAEDVMVLL